jgi:hypothetical protein
VVFFSLFLYFVINFFKKLWKKGQFASAEGAYSVCVVDHPGQKWEIEKKKAEKKFDRK